MNVIHFRLFSFRFQQVFRSPMTGYNVLIHLHKKHLPLAAQGVDVAMATDSTHSKQSRRGHPIHFPITDFNPVEKYLKELEVRNSTMTSIINEKLRKKGKKQHNTTQQKDKATQHNSPKAGIFQRKKLPRVGFKPTTIRLLGDAMHMSA